MRYYRSEQEFPNSEIMVIKNLQGVHLTSSANNIIFLGWGRKNEITANYASFVKYHNPAEHRQIGNEFYKGMIANY
jgi:hypothetical protein